MHDPLSSLQRIFSLWVIRELWGRWNNSSGDGGLWRNRWAALNSAKAKQEITINIGKYEAETSYTLSNIFQHKKYVFIVLHLCFPFCNLIVNTFTFSMIKPSCLLFVIKAIYLIANLGPYQSFRNMRDCATFNMALNQDCVFAWSEIFSVEVKRAKVFLDLFFHLRLSSPPQPFQRIIEHLPEIPGACSFTFQTCWKSN